MTALNTLVHLKCWFQKQGTTQNYYLKVNKRFFSWLNFLLDSRVFHCLRTRSAADNHTNRLSNRPFMGSWGNKQEAWKSTKQWVAAGQVIERHHRDAAKRVLSKAWNQTQAFIVKNQNSWGHKGKGSRENEADGQKETWDDNLTPIGVLVSTAGGAQRPPGGQDGFHTCYRSHSCTKEPEVTRYRSRFHRVMWPHRMQTSGRSRPRSDRQQRRLADVS